MKILDQFKIIVEHANKEIPYNIIDVSGGRGSGKSINVYQSIILHALQSSDDILLMRWIQNSIRQSSFNECKNLIIKNNLESHFKFCDTYIESKPTGARIEWRGAYQQNDSIRSLSSNYVIIVLEEAQQFTDQLLQVILATCMRFKNILVIPIYNITTTNNPAYKRFFLDDSPETFHIHINYHNNPYFPKAMDLQRLKDQKLLTLQEYQREWEGIPQSSLSNAIFNENSLLMLQDIKIEPELFEYEKIIISYDPAISDKNVNIDDKSNSQAISILGLKNGCVYLIGGYCEVCSPAIAVDKIVEFYYQYKCDYVLYESNQGGLFIKDLILSKDNKIITKSFTSTASKTQRASVIIPSIDMDKVKILESSIKNIFFDQATRLTLNGFLKNFKNESPDFLDCVVFGIIDLLELNQRQTTNTILPPSQKLPLMKYEFNILIVYAFEGLIYAVDCDVFSLGSEYAIKVNKIAQDFINGYENNKEFDKALYSKEFSGLDLCNEKYFFKDLPQSINLLDNLKKIEIVDKNFENYYSRYTGDQSSDNPYLRMVLFLSNRL